MFFHESSKITSYYIQLKTSSNLIDSPKNDNNIPQLIIYFGFKALLL